MRHLWTLVAVVCFIAGPWPGTAGLRAAPADAMAANTDAELVYIDIDGVVRVYDPSRPDGARAVQWFSPMGGWRDAALVDVNGDGDAEIVAIGGNGSASRLAVYDPVVATEPIEPDKQINGLFWTTLFETELPDTPRLVTGGHFNPAVSSQDIVVVFDEPGTDGKRTQVRILTSATSMTDGRSWRTFAETASGDRWTDLATGDLDLTGVDELALVDEEEGVLDVQRVQEGAFTQLYRSDSSNRRWSDVKIGHVNLDTLQPELVTVRSVQLPLASLVVLRYESGEFVDEFLRDFNPSPCVVFLADVTGSGDSEIFMLRDVPSTAPATTAQLIMRNRGPDQPAVFEVRLDNSNAFRYGAGGDLDGDGRDEVAVISATQLRIFNSPDTSTTDLSNIAVSSNARTIQIGNLDAIGGVVPDTLGTTTSRIGLDISAGTIGAPIDISLVDVANGRAIPLYVQVTPTAPFVRWSLSSATTPSVLSVTVDASELLPGGKYGTNLIVDTGRVDVLGAPLTIPVLVTVNEGLVLRPSKATALVYPCSKPDVPEQTIEVQVWGTEASFTAAVTPHTADSVLPAVDWPTSVSWVTSVSSVTTTVPASVRLTVDADLGDDFAQADLTVAGTLATDESTVERVATVTLVCPQTIIYLPAIMR